MDGVSDPWRCPTPLSVPHSAGEGRHDRPEESGPDGPIGDLLAQEYAGGGGVRAAPPAGRDRSRARQRCVSHVASDQWVWTRRTLSPDWRALNAHWRLPLGP